MLTYLIISAIVIISLFLFYASYSIRSGVYIKALCQNKKKDKIVSLTFDDGPDQQTEKVLDILKEYDVKACFFCIGSKIAENKDVLKRMKNEGHLIGNHSHSHFFSFPLHSVKWIKQDLESCNRHIEEITQDEVKLFRPPFGVTNPLIAKAVRSMNYTTIGWSIRSLDTCNNVDKTLARIYKKLKPGAVILLHDPLPESDILLRNLLDSLKENEYKVERVDKLFDLKLN